MIWEKKLYTVKKRINRSNKKVTKILSSTIKTFCEIQQKMQTSVNLDVVLKERTIL